MTKEESQNQGGRGGWMGHIQRSGLRLVCDLELRLFCVKLCYVSRLHISYINDVTKCSYIISKHDLFLY